MLEDQVRLDYKVSVEHQVDEEEWAGEDLPVFEENQEQMEKLARLGHKDYKDVQGQ